MAESATKPTGNMTFMGFSNQIIELVNNDKGGEVLGKQRSITIKETRVIKVQKG